MSETNKHISLTVVVPCYNEADRIEIMFEGFRSFIEKWNSFLEIIIINDGSKDDTEKLILEHELFKKHSNIFTLVSQKNTGKGGALRHGVLKANGEFILTLDADMAAPPLELLYWLESGNCIPTYNSIYIGSREHKESVITKTGNRKVIGNIFNTIVRVISPLKMKDTQCGFKFYPTQECKRIFETLQTYGWAHDVEILYKAHLDNVKIIEMPLNWHAVEGSKINVLSDGIKMLFEIFTIMLKTKFSYKSKK